jgi:hypothetical protein
VVGIFFDLENPHGIIPQKIGLLLLTAEKNNLILSFVYVAMLTSLL